MLTGIFARLFGFLCVLAFGVMASHAEPASKCDPVFVTMNAELTHATIACNKDYMDTKIGIDVMELAHECDAVLGRTKIHSIMLKAMRNWENVAKEKGKHEACEMTDKAFNAVAAAANN
jgi:hypothetical protein